MIIASILYNSNQSVVGYQIQGHAGYKHKGKDIICSAVSMLTINTAMAIEQLTDTGIDAHEEDGILDVRFTTEPDDKCMLLMDAMIIGLKNIQTSYGKRYLDLENKEV